MLCGLSRGPNERVLSGSEPPNAAPAHQHIKRHLRERSRDVVARFYGLSVGAERYASDLRDSHPGSGRKNPHHLKARGKAAFSLLFQTNMDGVKLLVAIDGCT